MMMKNDHALLVLLTRNPGLLFNSWLDAFNALSFKPDTVLVIDSSSTDDTQEKVKAAGFDLLVIDKEDFNHGSTRRDAVVNNPNYELIVFMTQDAILSSPESFNNILAAFVDDSIAAVCGRQIPRPGAGYIEAHSRLYNYLSESSVRAFEDKAVLGVKTAFLSNSFAAYRRDALLKVGGFPGDVIFGEDMYVAAKLLMSGYKIAYAADACVFHSHNYSLRQEFNRYFDMGVFHAHETWIREEFGGAEKAGMNYVISEMKYLAEHAFWLIPEGLLRTALRYMGFRLGLFERHIPVSIKRTLCMNKGYFKRS